MRPSELLLLIFIHLAFKLLPLALLASVFTSEGGLAHSGPPGTCSQILDSLPWDDNDSFLVPNETRPHDASNILQQVGPGAIVGVGSERLIFNFLLAPEGKDRSILAVDNNPNIIVFHQVNKILLKIASDSDVDAYRKLRVSASWEEWVAAADEALSQARITEEEYRQVVHRNVFAWWSMEMRAWEWRSFYKKPRTRVGQKFYGVNYLYKVDLFSRIQSLARNNRYSTAEVDLSDGESFLTILQGHLGEEGRLALFDLSNAWQGSFRQNYLGLEGTAGLVSQLNTVARDQTILLTTRLLGRWAVTTLYRGYRFTLLRKILNSRDGAEGDYALYECLANRFYDLEFNLMGFNLIRSLLDPEGCIAADLKG